MTSQLLEWFIESVNRNTNNKARRFAATFRDGVSKGENRDSPLWLLVRIHFAPTLKFLKFK